jgi:hypothetical protein
LIAVVACCLCFGAAVWFYLRPPLAIIAARYPYPRSWDSVQLGDTPQAVAQKCPGIDQSLQKIKADFDSFEYPGARWFLEVHYGPAYTNVTDIVFVLRLGSRIHFREVLYKRTSPNHALQRTGSAVTAPAADHRRLSTHRQVPRPLRLSLSLGR